MENRNCDNNCLTWWWGDWSIKWALWTKTEIIRWNEGGDFKSIIIAQIQIVKASKFEFHVAPLTDNLTYKMPKRHKRLILHFGGPTSYRDWWEFIATKSKMENSRWRSHNFKCIYLRSQTRDQRNFNGCSHFCWRPASNGTTADTAPPNRKL